MRWAVKNMHGQFMQETAEKRSDETWLLLKRETLQREMENLITSA